MKFKRLHSQIAYNGIVIPFVMLPIALFANKILTGKIYITKALLIGVWLRQDIIL
jgi:hypothetical protein